VVEVGFHTFGVVFRRTGFLQTEVCEHLFCVFISIRIGWGIGMGYEGKRKGRKAINER
jgi:hypothetical protein